MNEQKNNNRPPSWMSTSSLGLELAIVLGLGVWAGNKADQKYGCEPLGVLLGVFFGFIYGSYSFWKLLKMSTTNKKKDKKASDASS